MVVHQRGRRFRSRGSTGRIPVILPLLAETTSEFLTELDLNPGLFCRGSCLHCDRVNINRYPDRAAKWDIMGIPVYCVNRSAHETVRTPNIDEAVRLMNEVFGR